MKIAAKGRYIQSNHFDFEVAQKYGEYDKYEHTMAILYKEEPILVGIFTESPMCYILCETPSSESHFFPITASGKEKKAP